MGSRSGDRPAGILGYGRVRRGAAGLRLHAMEPREDEDLASGWLVGNARSRRIPPEWTE
jgi:hypothetical protein